MMPRKGLVQTSFAQRAVVSRDRPGSASVYCKPRVVWRQQSSFHGVTFAHHRHGSL